MLFSPISRPGGHGVFHGRVEQGREQKTDAHVRSMQSAASSGVRSRLTPRASRTSALPH